MTDSFQACAAASSAVNAATRACQQSESPAVFRIVTPFGRRSISAAPCLHPPGAAEHAQNPGACVSPSRSPGRVREAVTRLEAVLQEQRQRRMLRPPSSTAQGDEAPPAEGKRPLTRSRPTGADPVISLASCLPRPAFATSCHVGSAAGLLDTLRHLMPTAQDWAPLWDSRAPTAARGPAAAALHARHPASAWPVSELQLFTDGSFKGPGRLGWAVTIFERCTDGYCEWHNFLGSFSGTLDAWAARGLCAAEDNIDAESVAFCAATLWALSCPDTVPLSVWTDCQSVLQVVTGSADSQKQGPTSRLLGCCRCLWQALCRKAHPPQAHWIPGHAGLPPNELTDHIAKQACEAPAHGQVPMKFFDFLQHPLLGWLWHFLRPAPSLPPLAELLQGAYEEPDPVPLDCVPKARPVASRHRKVRDLNLCTYNVQSMRGKKDLLRAQFAARKMHVVFFQETRLSDGFCNAPDYYEVRGPSHKGNLGCAIWVARSSPLGSVDKRHIKVLFAEPRLLIARLNAPNLSCYLISAHAPHSGTAAEALQSWWETTERRIRTRCTGRLPFLVGIDANAQVGQITSSALGDHAADAETTGGEFLRLFCESQSLCAPSTFAGATGEAAHQDAEAYTWVSPSGGQYRLDYVLVPQGLLPAVRTCRVHHDFDDGAAVVLSLEGLPEGEPTYEYPRISLRTVEDVRAAEAPFQDVCREAASMPWSANVHQQVASLDQAIWRACGHRPSQLAAHRPYVNEALWQLIRRRKALLSQIRQAGLQQNRARLILGFRSLCTAVGTRPVNRRRLLGIAFSVHTATQDKVSLVEQRKILRRELARGLRASKAEYIEYLARTFAYAADKSDIRALFNALRFFRPAGKTVFKGFGPLAVLLDDKGEAAPTHSRQQEIHRKHFEQQARFWTGLATHSCPLVPGLRPFSALQISRRLPRWRPASGRPKTARHPAPLVSQSASGSHVLLPRQKHCCQSSSKPMYG